MQPPAMQRPVVGVAPPLQPWRNPKRNEEKDRGPKRRLPMPKGTMAGLRGAAAGTPAAAPETPDAISAVLGALEAAQAAAGIRGPAGGGSGEAPSSDDTSGDATIATLDNLNLSDDEPDIRGDRFLPGTAPFPELCPGGDCGRPDPGEREPSEPLRDPRPEAGVDAESTGLGEVDAASSGSGGQSVSPPIPLPFF